MSEQIVAVMRGGDWNDAAVEHVILFNPTEDMNMLYRLYRDWLRGDEPWATFVEWIVRKGHGRRAEEKELRAFWED